MDAINGFLRHVPRRKSCFRPAVEWLIFVPSKIGLRELVDILEKTLFCLITNDFLSDAVDFEMV